MKTAAPGVPTLRLGEALYAYIDTNGDAVVTPADLGADGEIPGRLRCGTVKMRAEPPWLHPLEGMVFENSNYKRIGGVESPERRDWLTNAAPPADSLWTEPLAPELVALVDVVGEEQARRAHVWQRIYGPVPFLHRDAMAYLLTGWTIGADLRWRQPENKTARLRIDNRLGLTLARCP